MIYRVAEVIQGILLLFQSFLILFADQGHIQLQHINVAIACGLATLLMRDARRVKP